MTLRRRAFGLGAVISGIGAALFACTGDDPNITSVPSADAGPTTTSDANAPETSATSDAGSDAPAAPVLYDATFGTNGVASIQGGIRSISGAPGGKGELAYIDSTAGTVSLIHWLAPSGASDPNTPLTRMTADAVNPSGERPTLLTPLWDAQLLVLGGAGDRGDGTEDYFFRGVPLDRPTNSPGVGYSLVSSAFSTAENPDFGVYGVAWPHYEVNQSQRLTALALVDSHNREYALENKNGAGDSETGFGELGGFLAAPTGGNDPSGTEGRVAMVSIESLYTNTLMLRVSRIAGATRPTYATDFGMTTVVSGTGGALGWTVAGTAHGSGIARASGSDYLVVAGSSTQGLVGVTVKMDGTNAPAALAAIAPANDFALKAFVSTPLANLHYAGGCIRQSTAPTPWIARLTADGKLDTTFGTNGVVTLDAMTNACVTALGVDDQDRVVAVVNPLPFSATTTSLLVRFGP